MANVDKAGFFKSINELNAHAIILRFYADSEGDIMMDAWYPRTYGKTDFGAFIGMIGHDMRLLFDEQIGLKALLFSPASA